MRKVLFCLIVNFLTFNLLWADGSQNLGHGQTRKRPDAKTFAEEFRKLLNGNKIDAAWRDRVDNAATEKANGKPLSDRGFSAFDAYFETNPERVGKEILDFSKALNRGTDEYYALLGLMVLLRSEKFDPILSTESQAIIQHFAGKNLGQGFFRGAFNDKDDHILTLFGLYGRMPVLDSTGQGIVQALALNFPNSDQLLDILGHFEKRALPYLFSFLASTDRPKDRGLRAEALGHIQGIQAGLAPHSWRDLDSLWEDVENNGKVQAVDPKMVEEQKKILVDGLITSTSEQKDRAVAIRGLVNALETRKWGGSLSFGAPRAAQTALVHFGKESIPALKDATKSKDDSIAGRAWVTLARIGGRSHDRAIFAEIKGELGKPESKGESRRFLYWALANYDDIYPKEVQQAFEAEFSSKRATSTIASGTIDITNPGTIKLIITLLEKRKAMLTPQEASEQIQIDHLLSDLKKKL